MPPKSPFPLTRSPPTSPSLHTGHTPTYNPRNPHNSNPNTFCPTAKHLEDDEAGIAAPPTGGPSPPPRPSPSNERDDSDEDEVAGRRSNSSDLYGRDRNRACWARSVQVTDYVMVNGGTTNIGAFVVWNIKVETLSVSCPFAVQYLGNHQDGGWETDPFVSGTQGSRINIRKRYSEFDDLRKKLVKTFPNFEAAVPALPPKSVLKRYHPRFLEKRRAGLQYFLK
jgi:hypothetical protein